MNFGDLFFWTTRHLSKELVLCPTFWSNSQIDVDIVGKTISPVWCFRRCAAQKHDDLVALSHCACTIDWQSDKLPIIQLNGHPPAAYYISL